MKKPCISGKKHEIWHSYSPDLEKPETDWGHKKFSKLPPKIQDGRHKI